MSERGALKRKWSLADLPDLSGKRAVVTGGNVGLGYRCGLELARQGAHVVIACRSVDKGRAAEAAIRAAAPQASLETLPLDLSAASSIEAFASNFLARHPRLDILMNNAGVVNLEQLQRTPEGRELHMATNHLGHFALTARLLPALTAAPAGRVVTVSSLAYRYGEIRFDDLDWRERPYDRIKAYGDSKLANLLFTLVLQRKLEAAGASAIAVAAHPGLTGTERQQAIGIGGVVAHWLASPVAKGCRSQLLAATEPAVAGGDFYGPRFGMLGYPALRNDSLDTLDTGVAEKLWGASEELTGVACAP